MLTTLTVDTGRRVEGLNVIVGTPDTKEGEGELQTHVAWLVTLRSDSDKSVVFHVRDDKSVWGTNRVVVVNVLRLL